MKPLRILSPLALAVLLVGCSGSSEPSAGDSAAAKDNFSRPMTDAEKAAGTAGTPGGGAPADRPKGP